MTEVSGWIDLVHFERLLSKAIREYYVEVLFAWNMWVKLLLATASPANGIFIDQAIRTKTFIVWCSKARENNFAFSNIQPDERWNIDVDSWSEINKNRKFHSTCLSSFIGNTIREQIEFFNKSISPFRLRLYGQSCQPA